MNCVIYIPHIYGDCVDGFEYQGGDKLDEKTYISMLNNDIAQKRVNFDRIAYGGFETIKEIKNKKDIKVKEVSVIYNNCACTIYNDEEYPIEYEELVWNYKHNKKFAVTLLLHNLVNVVGNEIITDLKRFLNESANVLEDERLVMKEKIFHLPKIDFKVEFPEKETTAILKDCKIVKPMALNKFSIIVNEIKFLRGVV